MIMAVAELYRQLYPVVNEMMNVMMIPLVSTPFVAIHVAAD